MSDMSREEALAHFGIKGMRWGVRKDEETLSSDVSPVTKEEYNKFLKNQPKKNKVEVARSIAKHEVNFKAKFESNDAYNQTPPVSKKSWRPTKKQLTIAATGAAFVGLAAASYYVKNNSGTQLPNLSALAGKRCTVAEYKALMDGSIQRCLGEKWSFTDYSWRRPELSFPPGHVFHRISMAAEKSFSDKGTYCTTSKEEIARYMAATSYGDIRNHHITWTSPTETRVPKLSTVLKTAKKALSEESGKRVSSKQAFQWYLLQGGGAWDFNDPLVSRFFDKLKEQGYHAIIDETDAGIYAENPLVWFDRSTPSIKQSTQITLDDISEATSILTEIIHRK